MCEIFDPRSCQVRSPGEVNWPSLKKSLQSCPACSVCQKGFKLRGLHAVMGAYNLYISDFLYPWPKVRSVAWPFHYKSMEKNENASRSVCTHRNSPNISESQWFGPPVTTKVSFLLIASRKVIRGPRSFEATNRFLPITLDWKEIERWCWPHCVCLAETHRLICNMTFSGQTLTWGQILKLTFQGQIIVHSTRLGERNTILTLEMT